MLSSASVADPLCGGCFRSQFLISSFGFVNPCAFLRSPSLHQLALHTRHTARRGVAVPADTAKPRGLCTAKRLRVLRIIASRHSDHNETTKAGLPKSTTGGHKGG